MFLININNKNEFISFIFVRKSGIVKCMEEHG